MLITKRGTPMFVYLPVSELSEEEREELKKLEKELKTEEASLTILKSYTKRYANYDILKLRRGNTKVYNAYAINLRIIPRLNKLKRKVIQKLLQEV